VLREFWRDFTSTVGESKDLRVGEVLEALNETLGPHVFPARADGGDPRLCPKCGTGQLSLKISGRNGAFVGCGNYPDCRYTRQLTQTAESAEASAIDGKVLGEDPQSGLAVTLRNGRFGPYLQLGEAADKDDKPKRASIPKGIDPAGLDLAKALQLLSLPREIGLHPETRTPVTAGLGRFGPFILHDGTYVNLESVDEVFSIQMNRAAVLLAEKRAGGGKGRFQRAKPKVLKELGEHPAAGGKVEVLEGRYGPYVSHNKVNATIPRGSDPAALTMEAAVALLAERIAKDAAKPAKASSRKGKAAAKTSAKAEGSGAAKGRRGKAARGREAEPAK
jgi:DNA topoisomerase-1